MHVLYDFVSIVDRFDLLQVLLTESATITHAIIPPDARKKFVSVRKMTAYKLGLGVIVASIQV